MRSELDLMELADRYLSGSLNASDRAAFEERMRTNAELRELVKDLGDLQGGMQRLVLRPAVDKAYRSYKWSKWLPGIGGMVIVAALLLSVPALLQRTGEQLPTQPLPLDSITTEGVGEVSAPDTSLSEPAQGNVERRTTVRTDTVVMMMQNGRLVPVTEQDTAGKGQLRVVKQATITAGSREALQRQLDSVRRSAVTDQRIIAKPVPPDSLRKLLEGEDVPRIE
jgi:hypothetical protein